MEVGSWIPKVLSPELHFVTQLNIADLFKLQKHLQITHSVNSLFEDDDEFVEFQGAHFRIVPISLACEFWLDCIVSNSPLVSVFLGGNK